MSFLSRWFGSSHPLDEIRKASIQQRWADVLSFASSLDDNSLSLSDKEQLQELVDTASEFLAKINFDEGLASLRSDEFRRGMEHLDLARLLVHSSELRALIDAEFARLGDSNHNKVTGDVSRSEASSLKKSCTSSCCGTTAEGPASSQGVTSILDEETHFDLILTAYPVDLHPRYLNLSTLMRQAILFAHEERTDEALNLFSKVLDAERDDIFFYELGSLFARSYKYLDAVKALQQALDLNPGYVLAAMTLVDLHVMNKNYAPAESLLSQMFQSRSMHEYCHARFAVISQAQGDLTKAFEQAKKALSLGHNDPELMVFVARALEEQGRIDEAEGVLSSIPVGGGCSGGANVELADFWLRHKKNLQKSLEMFKNAAKGDPTNPLWGYNIARVYMALGWTKEAKQILETFVNADSIDSSLRENAIQLLRVNS